MSAGADQGAAPLHSAPLISAPLLDSAPVHAAPRLAHEVAEPRTRRAWIAVSLLVLVALALRVPNIGRLGLVADEGHQALAVAGILEHGIPEVPAGTVYLRGAPFTYSEAALGSLFGINETTLRLPAALFGAVTVALIVVFGRMLFGFPVALVAGLLLTFSLWELELARYARMYTLFQLGFLGSAFAFYRGMIEGRRGWRPVAIAFMMLTLVTHQLGVFVLLFFIIPALLPDEVLPPDQRGRRRFLLFVPAIALGALWLAYVQLEGNLIIRNLTPLERMAGNPGGGGAGAGGPGNMVLKIFRDHLLIPQTLLAWELRGSDLKAVAGAFGVALVAGVAAMTALARRGRWVKVLWALAVLGAAFMNQLTIAIALAVAYLIVLPGGLGEVRRRPLGPALAGAAALALYWSFYALRHPAVLHPAWREEPHSIATALFGYPPVAERVLSWFLRGWPFLTIVVAATLIVLLVSFAADRRRVRGLYAALVLLLPLIAVSATSDIFNESRYYFHLYPFFIVLFALALTTAARFLTATADTLAALVGRGFPSRRAVEGVLITVLALLGSPDIAPAEIVRFLERDYATPKDPVRAILNWAPYGTFHQDHVGPAKLVRAELAPDDKIVVVGPTYWTSIYWHYVGRMEYAVSESAEPLMRDGVMLHHVTGARCITTVDELDEMLAAESGRRLWIFGDLHLLGDGSHYFSPAMKAKLRALARDPVLLGRDLDTFVVRRDPVSRIEPLARGL